MTDKEVLEYYSKHIDTNFKWMGSDGRLFAATPECDTFDFCELAGSDMLFHYRPEVEKHIKEKPIRETIKEVLKKIEDE
jgi:hypothetical protein